MKYCNHRFSILLLGLSQLLIHFNVSAFNDNLTDIHESIRTKYSINHTNNEEYSQISKDELVLFDVREKNEYAVSHIEGAIHVAPDITVDDFLSKHKEIIPGKVIVFYCSVGRRSSKLLSELDNSLSELGANKTYNLEGGIFQWHNDKKPLTRNGSITRDIHPYNFYWGRLIDDRDSIRYKITKK